MLVCFPGPAAQTIGGRRGFNTRDPSFIEINVPDWLAAQPPIVFTRRGAVDREVLSMLSSLLRRGLSFAGVADTIAEVHSRQHFERHLVLLQSDQHLTQPGQQQRLGQQSAARPPQVPPAGQLDPVFKRQYLSGVWLEHTRAQRGYEQVCCA
jgi:hypothetical protein